MSVVQPDGSWQIWFLWRVPPGNSSSNQQGEQVSGAYGCGSLQSSPVSYTLLWWWKCSLCVLSITGTAGHKQLLSSCNVAKCVLGTGFLVLFHFTYFKVKLPQLTGGYCIGQWSSPFHLDSKSPWNLKPCKRGAIRAARHNIYNTITTTVSLHKYVTMFTCSEPDL